jgi:hypothetical protein
MRPFMLLFFAAFALISCEDVQTNSPALQAELNGDLFRSIDARAEIKEDGRVIIQGVTAEEKITITLNNRTPGVYQLGGNRPNRAVFEDFLSSVYTSNPFGTGTVVIHAGSEDNTLSGTFRFDGYRYGLDTLLVRKGHFYQVPILAGSTIDEPVIPSNILTAVINGNNFSGSNVTTSVSGNLLTIIGTRQNQTLTLTFPVDIVQGNYPIGGAVTASYTLDGETFVAATGNLTVVNHLTNLNKISGAFSFQTEGPDVTNVAQGQFNASY